MRTAVLLARGRYSACTTTLALTSWWNAGDGGGLDWASAREEICRKLVLLFIDSEPVEAALIKGYSAYSAKEDVCELVGIFWELVRNPSRGDVATGLLYAVGSPLPLRLRREFEGLGSFLI